MRSLVQYIMEEEGITKVRDLSVIYDVKDNPLVVETPTNFNEDDMMVYLDDMCLDHCIAGSEGFVNVVGDNKDDMLDEYIEYDSFDVSDKSDGLVNLKWDAQVGGEHGNSDMMYYKLKDAKYIIKFSSFNLKNVDSGYIEKHLNEVFKALESNSSNKYKLNLVFNKVEYAR